MRDGDGDLMLLHNFVFPAAKVYFYVKILPGAALRSHYHLLSSLAVTVTCMSMFLSDLLFVLTPICSSVSPSVSLHRYFLFLY